MSGWLKVSVVTPSCSSRSRSRCHCSSPTCVVTARTRGGVALADLASSAGSVAPPRRSSEQHLPRRRVAGPGADPAREPLGLGDRRPHVLDRGTELALDRQDAASPSAARSGRSAARLMLVSSCSSGCGCVGGRRSRVARRTSVSRASRAWSRVGVRRHGRRARRQLCHRRQRLAGEPVVALAAVVGGGRPAPPRPAAEVPAHRRPRDREPGGEVHHPRAAGRDRPSSDRRTGSASAAKTSIRKW